MNFCLVGIVLLILYN